MCYPEVTGKYFGGKKKEAEKLESALGINVRNHILRNIYSIKVSVRTATFSF